MHAPLERSPPRRSALRATRRGFLIGGGATVGLLVGWAVWPRDRPLNWTVADDETRLSGWVKIGEDGRVIVACPQAEMGQGVMSGFAQIVADELGADWNTVGVEPAPIHPLYANTGMALDPLEAAPGWARGAVEWAADEAIAALGLQMTGGSTSIRGFHDQLRAAGATARELLCKAAARRWEIDWTETDAAGGFVTHKANRLPFAQLAADAANEEAAGTPRLRDTRPLAGKPLLRLDIPAKTDGTARFGTDVRLPGMVYAAVRSGPVGDPRLVRADDAAARARPGVLATVKGPSWVAVVAETWWGAKTALDTVRASFAVPGRPAGPWMDGALKAALGGPATAIAEVGEAAPRLAGTGAITADYTLPHLAHACMEPMNATARVTRDAAGLRAEVWAPTQSTTLVAMAVGKALGCPPEAVTVHATLLGGGFGRKAEADACVQAALVARDVKRPVQLLWTREEDFAQSRFRPAVAARMRGRVEDGRVTAWAARVAAPDTMASFMARAMPDWAPEPSAGAASVEGIAGLPYAFETALAEHALVNLPVPLGFWRSVGHSFTGFIVESFVDELAHAANIDPLTFRLNLLRDQPRFARVLSAAVEIGGRPGRVAPGVGRGLALVKSFGSICAQVVEVEVRGTEITVRKVAAAIDCGRAINPDSVRAQVEGGIVMGLGAALDDAMTFKDGRPEQLNFDTQTPPLLAATPEITVRIVESGEALGGVGEPGVPPVAPALANAVFAATGKRIRDLPLRSHL